MSFDPDGSFDNASQVVQVNVFQSLLTIPPGGGTPVPDAAKSCGFTAPTAYACTLKSGLVFSDGKPVTSADVKFSFERIFKINNPAAPANLFGNLKSVSTPSPSTVVFHLKGPDGTWPSVITSTAGLIVEAAAYPPKKLLPNNKMVGSGPYMLSKYIPGQETVLVRNPRYSGPRPKNGRVIIQYFDTSSSLALAIRSGSVDIAYRSLTPTDIKSLRSDSQVHVLQGTGSETRQLQIDSSSEPYKNVAVRRAIAASIDRQSIASNIYNGTVTPLYSMVPRGFLGHTDAFATVYGSKPNIAMARQDLQQAGIQTPVRLQIWYTPSHYGDASADEFTDIARQLDATQLFKVSLNSTAWAQYVPAAVAGQYPIYQLGWFGSFPDSDAYLFPFYSSHGYFKLGYANSTVNGLINREESTTNMTQRVAALGELQKLVAEDPVIIPLWQGEQIAVVRNGIAGVQSTLDPSNQFRFWLVSKS